MKAWSLLNSSIAAAALFVGAPAYAQEQGPAPTEETAQAEATVAPALWRLADEDTTIYLFGTVHMLPADIDWYSGSIRVALETSETLVTELDMTPESEAATAALIQSTGMLPEGQTLRGLMTDEQRAAYEGGLAKIGLPAEAFDMMEPWLAAIALVQIVTQATGYDKDRGVETVLEATVPEGTERIGLETIEFQLSVFDELPIDQQILYLIEGSEDPLEGIETLNQLVDVWARGDIEALGKLMNEGFMAHPNLAERLLYQRNANWAEWLDVRMDDPGTVFVAVGAGHLAGEKSVQDYLAERGIAVTRVQ